MARRAPLTVQPGAESAGGTEHGPSRRSQRPHASSSLLSASQSSTHTNISEFLQPGPFSVRNRCRLALESLVAVMSILAGTTVELPRKNSINNGLSDQGIM
ncbi:uncharacterized protein LOC143264509 isoform X2 [Megachile rotundata]|uniref:uncharacterized protein LOC143264509 isoform X2 n=1 Tax=Megachile rotundata TaxID=143995 RepID=UPI003FD64F26